MPEASTGDARNAAGAPGGARDADAIDRLTHDWLSGLLSQLVRAAGLLQPDRPGPGGRISLSESWALFELADGTPLTQRDLSQRLDLEKSTVSRLVAGMERRGLVTRSRNPDNRRFSRVVITDHGRTVLNDLASNMLQRHRLGARHGSSDSRWTRGDRLDQQRAPTHDRALNAARVLRNADGRREHRRTRSNFARLSNN
jgi:DNA-binding MarR family transcriptional regulator